MASNLSTIGFDLTDNAALQDLVIRLANAATAGLSSPVGDYVIWRSRTGAEIWFHLAPGGSDDDAPREIIGLTPFFEGRSSTTVRLTGKVARPGDNPFEGAFCAWIAPPDPPASAQAEAAFAGDEGSYPLVFDCIDYAVHAERTLPATCGAKLTGFARELRIFADDAAFDAAQSPDSRFAPQSFFPVGLFAASDATDENGQPAPPSSNALFNGRVVAHQLLTNEETGTAFHWVTIATLDATFDVVAHPDVVEGDIVPGRIAQAACWMFGRLLED